jgi:L-histidine N-alpha-methyltransferase
VASTRLIRPAGPGWRLDEGDGFWLHRDTPGDGRLGFASVVARGLEQHPRALDPRFLYDAVGSEIYERITEQAEYYPMRTEDSILEQHAATLADHAPQPIVVELGSGSSTKTRHLLDAWTARRPTTYVPIDISPSALQGACAELVTRYPDLHVEGIASTYERGLELVSELSPKVLLFLGSSIGNLEPEAMQRFFARVARCLQPGDAFVLGIDLVKDPAVLEAAYADAAGHTEQFIVNVFARMNRELGAEVDLDGVSMVSYFNDDLERVEMFARFAHEQQLVLQPLDRHFRLAAGEQVLVEISRKFHVDRVAGDAARFDLSLEEVFTDEQGWFAVLRFERMPTLAVVPSAPLPEPPRPRQAPVGELRLVPAGPFRMGVDADPVELGAYRIGAAPVTNVEYLRFVEAGGYSEAALWEDEGWEWVRARGVHGPAHWVLGDDGIWRARWRGRIVPLDPLRPVAFVSAWEAQAYAKWMDARLPTESEWEKAAAWDPGLGLSHDWPWGDEPIGPHLANVGSVLGEPVAVGSYPQARSFYGLHQVLGDVWEWTHGARGPVLRGGACDTPTTEVRCTTRLVTDASTRGVVTTGIRLARDA